MEVKSSVLGPFGFQNDLQNGAQNDEISEMAENFIFAPLCSETQVFEVPGDLNLNSKSMKKETWKGNLSKGRDFRSRNCFFSLMGLTWLPLGVPGCAKGAKRIPKASPGTPKNVKKLPWNPIWHPWGAKGGLGVGTPLKNTPKSIKI